MLVSRGRSASEAVSASRSCGTLKLDGSVDQGVAWRACSERSVVEVLRPDADDDLFALVLSEQRSLSEGGGVKRKSLLAEQEADVAVRALDRPFEQVHRRGADEGADE